MARIFRKPNSPFWWIEYRDPAGARTPGGRLITRRESTGLQLDHGPDTRRARELQAERTLLERRSPVRHSGEEWELWVTAFIQSAVRGGTRYRYHSAWRTLSLFLEEQNIRAPRQLTYLHCTAYLPWREQADKRNGKYRAGTNTAILEMKILRWIMREAVKRGYAPGNPAREVVLKRAPRKLFAELSDDDLALIWNGLKTSNPKYRPAMQRSFLVALHHGVRLRETQVNPLRDVFQLSGQWWIRFLQKGNRLREVPLHPALIPLFQQLRDEKQTTTYPELNLGSKWFKFMEKCGLRDSKPTATFHSLRVTVQNRLRRCRAVPRETRMEYLGHLPSEVHDAYSRWNYEDFICCHQALQFPFLGILV